MIYLVPGPQKSSRIWTIDADELREIVAPSRSTAEVLTRLGFTIGNQGAASDKLRRRCLAEGIILPRATPTETGRAREQALELVLVEGSTYSRHTLKKRLLRDDVIPYICAVCGCGPEWRGLPLVLRLDHENGIRNDNRIGNLRFVCPNCDSQLPTFAGRNRP